MASQNQKLSAIQAVTAVTLGRDAQSILDRMNFNATDIMSRVEWCSTLSGAMAMCDVDSREYLVLERVYSVVSRECSKAVDAELESVEVFG